MLLVYRLSNTNHSSAVLMTSVLSDNVFFVILNSRTLIDTILLTHTMHNYACILYPVTLE